MNNSSSCEDLFHPPDTLIHCSELVCSCQWLLLSFLLFDLFHGQCVHDATAIHSKALSFFVPPLRVSQSNGSQGACTARKSRQCTGRRPRQATDGYDLCSVKWTGTYPGIGGKMPLGEWGDSSKHLCECSVNLEEPRIGRINSGIGPELHITSSRPVE